MKSDKFDKAVKRVRESDTEAETTDIAAGGEPKSLGELGAEGMGAMVRRANAGSLAARMRAGEIEAAVQLFKLDEGTEITARVLKSGTTKIEDVNSKEMKDVTTWQLHMLDPDTFAPGPRVSILGSAQLDRQLPDLVGKVAIIARGGDIRIGKKVMTEYFVGEVKNAQ
jgi:hypothetical protein